MLSYWEATLLSSCALWLSTRCQIPKDGPWWHEIMFLDLALIVSAIFFQCHSVSLHSLLLFLEAENCLSELQCWSCRSFLFTFKVSSSLFSFYYHFHLISTFKVSSLSFSLGRFITEDDNDVVRSEICRNNYDIYFSWCRPVISQSVSSHSCFAPLQCIEKPVWKVDQSGLLAQAKS